jgi:hypothetical protein
VWCAPRYVVHYTLHAHTHTHTQFNYLSHCVWRSQIQTGYGPSILKCCHNEDHIEMSTTNAQQGIQDLLEPSIDTQRPQPSHAVPDRSSATGATLPAPSPMMAQTSYYGPSPLISSVQNIPLLKGAEYFAKWQRSCMGLMASHKKWYFVENVVVPKTSTSVRRPVHRPIIEAVHPNEEDDRADVWGFLLRTLDDGIVNHLTSDALDSTLMDAERLWREIHQQLDQIDVRTAGRYVKKLFSMELNDARLSPSVPYLHLIRL